MQAKILAALAGIVVGISAGLGLGVIGLGVVILVGITRQDDGGYRVVSADILEALIYLDLLVAIVAGWLVGRWVLRVLHRQGFR